MLAIPRATQVRSRRLGSPAAATTDVGELLDDAELLAPVEHSDGGEHLDADVVAV